MYLSFLTEENGLFSYLHRTLLKTREKLLIGTNLHFFF